MEKNIKFYQKLFNHLNEEHNITPLQSEMDEIIHIVTDMVRTDIINDFEKFIKENCSREPLYI